MKTPTDEKVKEQDATHGEHHYGLYRMFFYGWLFVVLMLGVVYLLPIYTDIPDFSVSTLLWLLMLLAVPVFAVAALAGVLGLVKGFVRKDYLIVVSALFMLLITGALVYIGVNFENVIF